MPSSAARPYPWQRVPRLIQRIRYANAPEAHRDLDVLLSEFYDEHGGALEPQRLRCAMLLSYGLRGARLGGAPSEPIMDDMMRTIDCLARTRSWAGVCKLMHGFIDNMLGHVLKREQTRLARTIRKITHDLDNDPGQTLPLKCYAANAGLHADYLSRQFRITTGQTFCEARKAARLSRARSLLLASPIKVREVARRVGINDPGQFIREFQREYGMTANQYRLKHGRG